jgi:TetR/AcrR family transcriptional repressor of nem operon
VIDVGLQAVLTGGLNATGVKDVAEAAGVPKGSFYYYFSSKEAFAEAVVDRYARAGADQRAALLADTGAPPLARLRRAFEAYLPVFEATGYTGGCLLGNVSVEAADHSEALRERVRTAFGAWQASLRAVLAEAETGGELPDGLGADAMAAFLVNAWEGALVRMRAERSAEPLRLFLDVIFGQVLVR